MSSSMCIWSESQMLRYFNLWPLGSIQMTHAVASWSYFLDLVKSITLFWDSHRTHLRFHHMTKCTLKIWHSLIYRWRRSITYGIICIKMYFTKATRGLNMYLVAHHFSFKILEPLNLTLQPLSTLFNQTIFSDAI